MQQLRRRSSTGAFGAPKEHQSPPELLSGAQRIDAQKRWTAGPDFSTLNAPAHEAANPEEAEAVKVAPAKIEYSSKGALLSPAELAFFRVLNRVCKGRGVFIAVQVRLADVLMAPQGPGHQAAFNRIAKKHLDFVICDARNSAILGAIELDDSSHGRKRRQERDKFLNDAMASAMIPLYRATHEVNYDVQQLWGVVDALMTRPMLRSSQ
jgi:hypothetical protein